MDDYIWFTEKMAADTGIDLSLYKEEQMKRRLTSLKDKYQAETFKTYYARLMKSRDMLTECVDRITINVTEFFRNKKRWDVLEKEILPTIMATQSGRFRAWSAACSTGEEPYTLSILLSNRMPTKSFEILATDLDDKVLQAAVKGIYPERSLKEITEQDRPCYFSKEGVVWGIQPQFKTPIRFKKHNLLADPYEKGLDLIICRNVLIYFTDEAKQSLYTNFAKALRPGGVLFVGSTEQIFNAHTYGLEPLETFFYRKMG